MSKLEKKIIKKMYVFETQKTFLEFIVTIIVLIVGGVLIIYLALMAWAELVERQTLDLIAIFISDFETAFENWDTILIGLYHESPKEVLTILVVVAAIIACIILYLAKRHHTIQNKFHSLATFWFRNKLN